MVMRKIRYIIFLLIFILCGCTKEISNNIETEKVVKDNLIIHNISNQIKCLETLNTTYNLYTKGYGSIKDYNNDDKILYGINMSIRNEQITNNKFVEIKNIKNYSNSVFGTNNLSFHTVDNYLLDNDGYIINYKNKEKSIVSYIDKITTKYNYYYATVYVGIKHNDEVYGDLEETKLVQLLYDDTQYDISENDKELFTKYRYKFEKNFEGKYILVEFKKI